jgi:hypothetical protein
MSMCTSKLVIKYAVSMKSIDTDIQDQLFHCLAVKMLKIAITYTTALFYCITLSKI